MTKFEKFMLFIITPSIIIVGLVILGVILCLVVRRNPAPAFIMKEPKHG